MKSMKKIMSFIIVGALLVLVGCNKTENVSEKQNATVNEDVKVEDEKVTLQVYGSTFGQALTKSLMESYSSENPNVVFNVISEEGDGTGDALKILLGANEAIDIISLDNPIMMRTFAKNSLEDLTDYASKYNFDFVEAYGASGAEQCTYEKKPVMMSTTKTTWFLLYNKDIFDKFQIEYPSEDKPMTWTEYRELAQQLTHGEGASKKYGALSLQWPMFYYGEAIQELGGGEMFYTDEGLSNIEAPSFRKSFEHWNAMTNIDKSMPDLLTVISRQFPYTEFLSGNYGMHIYGSWVFGLLKDQDQFPRDWKVGIAPMPVPDDMKQVVTWGVYAGCGIPKSGENKEEAFKFLQYAVEKAPLLSESEITSFAGGDNSVLAKKLAKGLEEEGITSQLLEKVLFNPDIITITEKITGPASVEYESILAEEFQKYVSGSQDIDVFIKNVKQRADKAIKESIEN